MRLALYVHPFDLDALADHGGLARLADLGFSELALAVSYHDGRWLTPWHPGTRVRFLEDGTVHFRPSVDYGELTPLPSSEVPADGPSPLERLCADAPAHGLSVRAWTVFGHNTRLGLLHPERTVVNAFGDPYPYALCPSQPTVQRYHAALVADLARHRGLGAIELEALGQMGIQHSSHHDKKSLSPTGRWGFALSACFCAACRDVHEELGHDVDAVRRAAAACVTRAVTDGDAMAPAAPDDGEPTWIDAVLAARRAVVARLAQRVVEASGACARAVQVHPDPWFTGSQLAASAAAAFPAADERVLTCYGQGTDAIAKVLAHDGARVFAASPKRLCIWPKAPEFTRDEDLVRVRELCRTHGVDSVAIYHLGLLPWRTTERVAKMLAR